MHRKAHKKRRHPYAFTWTFAPSDVRTLLHACVMFFSCLSLDTAYTHTHRECTQTQTQEHKTLGKQKACVCITTNLSESYLLRCVEHGREAWCRRERYTHRAQYADQKGACVSQTNKHALMPAGSSNQNDSGERTSSSQRRVFVQSLVRPACRSLSYLQLPTRWILCIVRVRVCRTD